MSELRLYTFVNFYLSSIQQGIQTAHVVSEMLIKYSYENAIVWDEPRGKPFHDWAKNHKTIVVINGGANIDIEEKYALLQKLEAYLDFPMPFEKFSEDEQSLGGVMTAVGCVLPEEIYDARRCDTVNTVQSPNSFFFQRENEKAIIYEEGTPEHKLITMLKSCPLAR